MLALRGPSRATIEITNVTTDSIPSPDQKFDIDEVTFTLRVTGNPPLEVLEKMAIQILASRRPGSQNDGVVESSAKMFTVLPRAVPVPLAYTSEIKPDHPSPIIIVGRNLKDCTIDLGTGTVLHTLRSDDGTISAIVTVPQSSMAAGSIQLSLLDSKGNRGTVSNGTENNDLRLKVLKLLFDKECEFV